MREIMPAKLENNAARCNDRRQRPDERIFPKQVRRFPVFCFIRIPRQENRGNVKCRRNAEDDDRPSQRARE